MTLDQDIGKHLAEIEWTRLSNVAEVRNKVGKHLTLETAKIALDCRLDCTVTKPQPAEEIAQRVEGKEGEGNR